MFVHSTSPLTISKRKEVLDAIVHHREPPKVIHLDNVVEPAASVETQSSFSHQPESNAYVSPHPVGSKVGEFWKQAPNGDYPQSSENHVDDEGALGNTSASNDFYNMVLDILDTFHSAAEMEVRQTRKRDFQRQAALDMLM